MYQNQDGESSECDIWPKSRETKQNFSNAWYLFCWIIAHRFCYHSRVQSYCTWCSVLITYKPFIIEFWESTMIMFHTNFIQVWFAFVFVSEFEALSTSPISCREQTGGLEVYYGNGNWHSSLSGVATWALGKDGRDSGQLGEGSFKDGKWLCI